MGGEFDMEDLFLSACKSGDLETTKYCLETGQVHPNTAQGWGLRRAVRYNHTHVVEYLLRDKRVDVNLANKFGLTALHTAARFNQPIVANQLLKHPDILTNQKTVQGSSPVVVAVKYGRKEVLEVLIKDERVDLKVTDNLGRSLSGVLGVANSLCSSDDKLTMLETIKKEKDRRENLKKKKNTSFHEMDPSQLIVQQAREKVKRQIEAMEEFQKTDLLRFKENMESTKREFVDKQQSNLQTFLASLHGKWIKFLEKQQNEKNEYVSELDMQKGVFMMMQKETHEEFFANEDLSLEKFKEKQLEERLTLQLSQISSRNSRSFSGPIGQKSKQEQTSSEAAPIDNKTTIKTKAVAMVAPMKKHESTLTVVSSNDVRKCNDISSLQGHKEVTYGQEDIRKSSQNFDREQSFASLTKSHPSAANLNNTENKKYVEHVSGLDRRKSASNDRSGQSEADKRRMSCPAFINSDCTFSNQIYKFGEYYYSRCQPNSQDVSPLTISSRDFTPSPVPSLELVLSPDELNGLLSIPDTCPTIQALMSSTDFDFKLPFGGLTSSSKQLNSIPDKCNTTTIKSQPSNEMSPLPSEASFKQSEQSSSSISLMKSTNLLPQSLVTSPIQEKLRVNENIDNSNTSFKSSSTHPIRTNSESGNIACSSPKNTSITTQPIAVKPSGPPRLSLTPKLARKSLTMEILEEEDEPVSASEEDTEVAQITNDGVQVKECSTCSKIPFQVTGNDFKDDNINNLKQTAKDAHDDANNGRQSCMFYIEEENGRESIEDYDTITNVNQTKLHLEDIPEKCVDVASGSGASHASSSSLSSYLSLTSFSSTSSFKSPESSPSPIELDNNLGIVR